MAAKRRQRKTVAGGARQRDAVQVASNRTRDGAEIAEGEAPVRSDFFGLLKRLVKAGVDEMLFIQQRLAVFGVYAETIYSVARQRRTT